MLYEVITRLLGRRSAALEVFDDQFLLLPPAVLRQLPARVDARDIDLENDDASELV